MEQQEPICTVRGELSGRRLAPKRLCRPDAVELFDVYRDALREGRYTGWASWSQDGQLVGYACSPGYVRQERA